MDPVSVLTWAAVWAIVSATTYVTVTFILLTLDEVISWFSKYVAFRNRYNSGEIAVTIAKQLSNGDYNIVQAGFNKQTNELGAVRVIKAHDVDPTIQQAHSYGRKEVAVWDLY